MSKIEIIKSFYQAMLQSNEEKLGLADSVKHWSPLWNLAGKKEVAANSLQFGKFLKEVNVKGYAESDSGIAVEAETISAMGKRMISDWFTLEKKSITEIRSYFDASDMKPSAGTLPVLPVSDVSKAVDYYVETLGFKEDFKQPAPDGTIVAGQASISGSKVMFNLNPPDSGKEGGGIYLWFRIDNLDIDLVYTEFKKKGVKVKDEIQDQYWGDRFFSVRDLNGYVLAFNKAIKK